MAEGFSPRITSQCHSDSVLLLDKHCVIPTKNNTHKLAKQYSVYQVCANYQPPTIQSWWPQLAHMLVVWRNALCRFNFLAKQPTLFFFFFSTPWLMGQSTWLIMSQWLSGLLLDATDPKPGAMKLERVFFSLLFPQSFIFSNCCSKPAVLNSNLMWGKSRHKPKEVQLSPF